MGRGSGKLRRASLIVLRQLNVGDMIPNELQADQETICESTSNFVTFRFILFIYTDVDIQSFVSSKRLQCHHGDKWRRRAREIITIQLSNGLKVLRWFNCAKQQVELHCCEEPEAGSADVASR